MDRVSAQPASGDRTLPSFSLADMLFIVRRRWILGLVTGMVVSALVAFVMLNKPAIYEATASMVVEFNTDKIVDIQQVVEDGGNYNAIMNTHIQRLQGRAMAEYVLESFNQDHLYRFVTAGMDEEEKEAVDKESLTAEQLAGRLRSMVKASWLEGSQVLLITVRNTSPEIAQLLANRYVDRYIRLQLESRSFSTDQAVAFLDEQTEALQRRLEDEERALQEYRKENDMVSVEQNQQIITERLSQLSTAITDARVRLLSAQSKLKQVEEVGDDLERLVHISFIAGSLPVQEALSQQESLRHQRVVLSERYLERHPLMLRNEASLDAAREALVRAVEQARQKLLVDERTIQEELKNLNNEYHAAKEEAQRLEKLSIEYRLLERRVEAQRNSFAMVTERFNETSIAQQTQQMNLTTLRSMDPAVFPGSPVSPDPMKAGILAVFAFGFCFVGLPFLLELLDNRLKTYSDIERYIGKPVIGDVRMVKTDEADMAHLVNHEDDTLSAPFASLYGALRLSLGEFNLPMGLVVTSSIPAEGKSVIAINMARVLASHQLRTIVVDCDLRRPSIHRYLKLGNKKGVLNWIRSEQPIADDLFTDDSLGIQQLESKHKLCVLCSGGSTKQATTVFEEPRFDLLVSRLKQEFDVVIFDTPPVGLFHDATLVADYADHTIFVSRQGKVARQKTRHAVALMDKSRAPVIGCVLNAITNHAMAAGYGYQSSYSSSYGDQYNYGRYGKYAKYYEEKR